MSSQFASEYIHVYYFFLGGGGIGEYNRVTSLVPVACTVTDVKNPDEHSIRLLLIIANINRSKSSNLQIVSAV
jgi:hypothetical protein